MQGPEKPLRPPIEAITLDCWQTLLFESDPEPARAARRAALVRAAASAGRKIGPGAAQEILATGWKRHEAAWQAHRAVGADDLARWSLERLGLAPEAVGEFARGLAEAYATASLDSKIEALEGARETLDFLVSAKLRRALVCDTGYTPGSVMRTLLERAGLLAGLEALAFSDEVGVPKPEPAIFRHALAAIKTHPARAVHVGDLKRTDVAGARRLGMRTIRIRQTFDDGARLRDADWVVDSHAALRSVLATALED